MKKEMGEKKKNYLKNTEIKIKNKKNKLGQQIKNSHHH